MTKLLTLYTPDNMPEIQLHAETYLNYYFLNSKATTVNEWKQFFTCPPLYNGTA